MFENVFLNVLFINGTNKFKVIKKLKIKLKSDFLW
jgi:hypothetical protein